MTNTMLDLIKSRRSCRSYLDTAVPEEKLDAVLEAGTYAPTGGGRQSPVIVAVEIATVFAINALLPHTVQATRILTHSSMDRMIFLFLLPIFINYIPLQ